MNNQYLNVCTDVEKDVLDTLLENYIGTLQKDHQELTRCVRDSLNALSCEQAAARNQKIQIAFGKAFSGAQEKQKPVLKTILTDSAKSSALNLLFLIKLADRSLLSAQNLTALGDSFFYGVGVDKNASEGFELYLKGARAGDPAGLYAVGKCYETGSGVLPNFSKAARWYKKASAAGHPMAQYALGVLYTAGKGVRACPSKALHWITQAAEQGYAEAQYALGVCYQTGVVFGKEPEKSEKWMRLANMQGFNAERLKS